MWNPYKEQAKTLIKSLTPTQSSSGICLKLSVLYKAFTNDPQVLACCFHSSLYLVFYICPCTCYSESPNIYVKLVARLCLTLWDPTDWSLPVSSVHGILQERILEWLAMPFYRGSSQLRDWIQVSHIAGRSLPSEPPGSVLPEALW